MVEFGARTDTGEHYSWLYNHPEATQSFRQNNKELQELIHGADRIIAHNMKFEMLWMTRLGIDYSRPKPFCTQVAQYLIEGQFKGGKGYYGLDQVAERHGVSGKLDKVKAYWDSGYETDEIPANILVPYRQQDCTCDWQVFLKQLAQLKKIGHLNTIIMMQMRMLPLLAEIEWNGMLVNRELLVKLNEEYTIKVKDYTSELADISGEDINWGSNPQVSALLFGGTYTTDEKEEFLFTYKDPKKEAVWKCRNIKVPHSLSGLGFIPPDGSETKIEGVFSTADGIIKALKPRTKAQRRFLEVFSLRSKAEKLRSTYFEGLQGKVIDGYIHPSMNQTIARNGRLTSSNPNGQNLPRGSTGSVKSIFISRFD
jgi:DNA polymerase I-like protein with 3'-5' exonuclease and polymerase domains